VHHSRGVRPGSRDRAESAQDQPDTRPAQFDEDGLELGKEHVHGLVQGIEPAGLLSDQPGPQADQWPQLEAGAGRGDKAQILPPRNQVGNNEGVLIVAGAAAVVGQFLLPADVQAGDQDYPAAVLRKPADEVDAVAAGRLDPDDDGGVRPGLPGADLLGEGEETGTGVGHLHGPGVGAVVEPGPGDVGVLGEIDTDDEGPKSDIEAENWQDSVRCDVDSVAGVGYTGLGLGTGC
jgi:hypothetical protein